MEEIITLEEKIPDNSLPPVKAESFCTNWKCISKPVKLVVLEGEQVKVSVINENKE